MPKHTPGPWYCHLHKWPQVYVSDCGNPMKVVVDSVGPSATGSAGQERKANARLIAIAPEMYEYIEQMAEYGDDKALALIKQAKGE